MQVLVVGADEQVPFFRRSELSYFIMEDRSVGSVIATVTADGNTSLSYSILAGDAPLTNNPPHFAIDDNGRISVTSPLDREAIETYFLTVLAATESTPALVASCVVTVQVMDVNDNAPQFESDPYTVRVAENNGVGERVIQVIAHDADAGANANVTFELDAESRHLADVFLLDPRTGWITTQVSLDREQVPSYAISVVARDHGAGVQRSDVTRVFVNVMDVNDEAPVFVQDVYEAEVAEDASLGTTVVMVMTTDADIEENAQVAYYITSGDARSQFAIDATSGAISVRRPLDRETRDRYTLTVSATDGAFVTTALVRLRVTDANDNAPVCAQLREDVVVDESLAVGSLVVVVSATDADESGSPNSELSFELLDSHDAFEVKRDEGELHAS